VTASCLGRLQYGGMLRRLRSTFSTKGKKLWPAYKNVAAVRGLLQWLGWWKTGLATMTAVGVWFWAHASRLNGPERFVLALAAFALVLVVIKIGYLVRADLNMGTPKSVEIAKTSVERGKIPFDYLPHESPLVHDWTLLRENATAPIPPSFSALPADAPVLVGLSIRPNGWYGMDYSITEAQRTTCNRLIFAANFGTDGRFYVFLHMPSRVVGRTPEERWIKMGVNVGPDRVEGDEGVAGIIGKELRGGWASFDVSLENVVARTFGKRELFYGEHGNLLKIRFRGTLSTSEVEFHKG
jgi:hypothetical protein